MDNNTVTALATAFLAIVGFFQILVLLSQLYLLRSQKRNQEIDIIEVYRARWFDYQNKFGCLVYLGRELNEYYQIVDDSEVIKLNSKLTLVRDDQPTIWARDAVRDVATLMSDICIRVLQGSLQIQSVYPILGTAVLRQSLPLRKLLESQYDHGYSRIDTTVSDNLPRKHKSVREEVQDWLVYHTGTRRRCLILIDLLWSEAARLNDLPPDDLISAANAKINSGKKSRLRLEQEFLILNSPGKYFRSKQLSNYLKYSEYKKFFWQKGLSRRELKKLNQEWVTQLLENHR